MSREGLKGDIFKDFDFSAEESPSLVETDSHTNKREAELDIPNELQAETIKHQSDLTDRFEEISTQASEKFKDDPDKLAKIIEKGKRILKTGLKIVSTASLFYIAAVTADHRLTRWEVDMVKDPKTNTTIYKHQDDETNHLINVISGKEKLDEKIEIELIKDILCEDHTFGYLVRNGIWGGSIGDLQAANDKEVSNILRSLYEQKQKNNEAEIEDKTDEQLQESYLNVEPGVDDQTVYEAIWGLMNKTGNPRIRLTSDAAALSSFGANGSYNPLDNTIYLETSSSLTSVLLAEIAHSKQFNDRPYYNSLLALKGFAMSGVEGLAKGTGVGGEYYKQYEEAGTLEHDAHSVIEPDLVKSFNEATSEGPLAKAVKAKKEEQKLKDEAYEQSYRDQKDAISKKYFEERTKMWQERDLLLKKTKDFKKRIEIIKKYDHMYELVQMNESGDLERARKIYERKGIISTYDVEH